jgi:hypothetical protein
MISAGIKEIKNNLSRFLARVKMGEEVDYRKGKTHCKDNQGGASEQFYSQGTQALG